MLNLAIPIETFINANLGNLPKPLISANSATTPEEIEEPVAVNYTTLENQLKKSTWKEANDTTVKLMLQLVGREEEGWFSKESLAQLPCKNLKAIDNLWQKYSNNKFGFSVQKTVFEQTVIQQGSRNDEALNKFVELVDWKHGYWMEAIEKQNKNKNYDEINYNLNAPKGHLPVLPGVVPLAPINDIPASIKVSEDNSLAKVFVQVFSLVIISAIVFSIVANIIENNDRLNNFLERNLIFYVLLIAIGAITFALLWVSIMSNHTRLITELQAKKQQHFESLNKNRPIEGSKLLAGIEPLVSTLDRCEFPNLNNQK